MPCRNCSWVPNETPWVDRAIRMAWPRLAAEIDDAYLPVPVHRAVGSYKEYGCGVFGCVLPTSAPNVVLKITTDRTEAQFAALLLQEKYFKQADLEGIVTYHGVFALRGVEGRRGEGVYALWREEAHNVGMWRTPLSSDDAEAKSSLIAYVLNARDVDGYVNEPEDGWRRRAGMVRRRADEATRLVNLLSGRKDAEDALARLVVDAQAQGGAWYAAVNVGGAALAVENMMRTRGLGRVGDALSLLMAYGILLADVHQDNVGFVKRGRSKCRAITDPGRFMRLDPSVVLPKIEEL